jgi:M6 family metalloprotease-like protein
MNRRTILLIQSVFYLNALFAIQPFNNQITISQSDNSSLTINLNGDDFRGHSLTTTDGFEIIKDETKELYYYAYTDISGRLKSTEVIAHNPEKRSNSELVFLNSDKFKKAMKAKNLLIDPSLTIFRTFPSSGNTKLLMVLVNFSDKQFTHNQQAFSNMMNQPKYSNIGSFKEYYTEVSGGKLNVTTDVVNWVTVSNTHKYYGENIFSVDAARTELVMEVIQLIDPIINFADYDNDKDGVMDGLCIVHQGQGEEYVGSDPNNLWSSIGDLRKLYNPPYRELKYDGVTLGPFSLQPEIEGYTGRTGISTVGVFCHEFGHWLGLPDFYDTDLGGSGGQYYGTDGWDLMNSGTWNATYRAGDAPAHHNPYSKNKLGWNTTTILNSSATISGMKDVTVSNLNYRINTKIKGEYFLLENRQKKSFDAGVYNNGLVIYHVDSAQIEGNTSTNQVNISSNQGIVYERVSWKLSFPTIGTEFSDTSDPNALSNRNLPTEKPITNISMLNRQISFDFMGGINADVKTIKNNLGVSCFGNTIKITYEQGNNFKLYNMSGKLLFEGTINENIFNLRVESSGAYLLKINQNIYKVIIK